MASKRWTGAAAAVAQVDRFTPANVEVGDVFTLTATGEGGTTAAVSFTAAAATVANVTAGLAAAWNASTHPLHASVTAADATTSLTLTADAAGVPFNVASSTTDGGGANTQTLVRAVVEATAGPNDWETTANWSDFLVPVTGDTVVFDARSTDAVLYGLDQSAVTLARLTIYAGSPSIGTPATPLRIAATVEDINLPPTDGSAPDGADLIHRDAGAAATTCTVHGGRRQGVGGMVPVVWKGTHASNVLYVRGGTVGAATGAPGDVATLASLQVLGSAADATSPTVAVGSGVTLTTLTQTGGVVSLGCAATTVNQDGGTLTTEGTGAIGTLYANGTARLNSTGTITNLYVEPAGAVSFAGNTAPRTVTNAAVHGAGTLDAALPVVAGQPHPVTFTNGVACVRGAKSGQVDAGGDIVVSFAAV